MTLLKGWIFTYSHLGATLHMNEMYLKYAHFPTPNPANRKISNGQSISGLPRLNWRMQVNSQHDGFQPQSFGNFCETLTKIYNTPKEGVRYGKEQDRPAKTRSTRQTSTFLWKGARGVYLDKQGHDWGPISNLYTKIKWIFLKGCSPRGLQFIGVFGKAK